MDRIVEINNLITYISSKTDGITIDQIKQAREQYKDDSRDLKEIEKELWELSAKIQEQTKDRPQPKEATPEEMINNITGTLERPEIKDAVRDIWDKTKSLNVLSDVIGEVYLYHIIHRDGYNFDEYFDKFLSLYAKRLPKEEFRKEKINLLLDSIKDRLHITNIEMTKEEDTRVKDYFVTQYVENGYVAHSFHGGFLDSINKNGLSAEPSTRIWDNDEVNHIGDILSSHGVDYALGGYIHYKGKGLYYEHDMNNIYRHSLISPEWFNIFTSADHLKDLSDIEKNPFILRDYDQCRQNVEDLTINSDLSSEERKEVLRFFEKSFYDLSNPDQFVALIPKSAIGKNSFQSDSNAYETMYSALTDSKHEYDEHTNNYTTNNIPKVDLLINKMPRASTFIKDVNYKRESREDLYNESRIRDLDKHKQDVKKKMGESMNKKAEMKIDRIGDDTTVPRDVRIAKLKSIRSKVVEKSSKSQDMNRMFYTKPVNQQQVKENVSTAQKVMVKTNNTSQNDSGFANSALIIAISIMTLITSILLYLVK